MLQKEYKNCKNCNNIIIGKRCSFCKRKASVNYRNNLKKDIITNYGGKCFCCEESNMAFLTIDHIDGKGSQHRKETFKHSGNVSSSTFYNWLKKNNYPKDNYQVLCFNCNCDKHIYGKCPHKI